MSLKNKKPVSTVKNSITENDVRLPEDLYMSEKSGQADEYDKGKISGYRKGYVSGYSYGFEKAKSGESISKRPEDIQPPTQAEEQEIQPKSGIGIGGTMMIGTISAVLIYMLFKMRSAVRKRRNLEGIFGGLSGSKEIIDDYLNRIKAYKRQLEYYNNKGMSKQDIIYKKTLDDINKLKARLRVMGVEPNQYGL